MSDNFENRKSEKGFSLIELIVVLVILGLLAAVVGPKIMGKLSESKSRIAKIQISEFESALQVYSFDLGHLPSANEGLDALIHNTENSDSWNGPYLGKELPLDPWQRAYLYRYPGNHGDFDIYSLGANGIDGDEDDVCSWKR
jgi:general secretion pathway protein G